MRGLQQPVLNQIMVESSEMECFRVKVVVMRKESIEKRAERFSLSAPGSPKPLREHKNEEESGWTEKKSTRLTFEPSSFVLTR